MTLGESSIEPISQLTTLIPRFLKIIILMYNASDNIICVFEKQHSFMTSSIAHHLNINHYRIYYITLTRYLCIIITATIYI